MPNKFTYYYNTGSDYEKISLDLPSNEESSNYNILITREFNKNLFFEYSEKIIQNNINSPNQIKNYYLVDQDKVENYYKGNLKPENSDIWGAYTDYLFSRDQINKTNNPNILSKLPQFVRIKIPKIQGLKKEDKEIYDKINIFLTDYKKNTNTYSYEENYKYIFNNYMLTAPVKKSEPLIRDYNTIMNLENLNLAILNKNIYIENLKAPLYGMNYEDSRDILDEILNTNETFQKINEDIIKNNTTLLIPIFYKITKKRNNAGNTSKQETLQNIYIPYKYDETLEYIDNQVIPSDVYSYHITLICISAGHHFDVVNNRDVFYRVPKFIDIPFFNGIAIEKDSYPVIPEASILPMFNQPNNIKIFLNTKASYENPIYFSSAENINNNSLNIPLFFNKTEFNKFYIYKSNEAPSSYSSFKSLKPVIIDSNKNAFYDILELNKIYYYTFRSYDGRNFSNPSEVYQVEIKDINGAIIPIIKTFEFEEVNPLTSYVISNNDSFKQRISVKPSYYQLNIKEITPVDWIDTSTYKDSSFTFDRSKFDNLESIYQGTGGPSYKIRLISKTSGKMVDINLDYRFQTINNLKK